MAKRQTAIFISGNVPSSKNGRIWTGRFSIESKAVKKYKSDTKKFWEENRKLFSSLISKQGTPLTIGFHFVRGTKHKYDWVNPLQTVQDLMVDYKWIEDDNTDVIIPFPLLINNQFSSYSKDKPGVWIKPI